VDLRGEPATRPANGLSALFLLGAGGMLMDADNGTVEETSDLPEPSGKRPKYWTLFTRITGYGRATFPIKQ
jgi:hypothetical protein